MYVERTVVSEGWELSKDGLEKSVLEENLSDKPEWVSDKPEWYKRVKGDAVAVEFKSKPPAKHYTLVGIHGLARSGKDEVGRILLSNMGEDWDGGAFANVPKRMLNLMGIDTSDEAKDKDDPYYGISVRKMMQTLGTDWGRSLDEDIWIKAFTKLYPKGKYVITDVRMENEAKFIRDNGGIVIHVKGRGGINTTHPSEAGIEVKGLDVVIENVGTLEELREGIVNELVPTLKECYSSVEQQREGWDG